MAFVCMLGALPSEEAPPSYLYKVLSMADWNASQSEASVKLPPADDAFIHFSKEDQLERLLTKYWANESEYVILKIDTAKLQGKMAFEANPGGTTKYYHLYNGSIPMDAIADSKLITQKKM